MLALEFNVGRELVRSRLATGKVLACGTHNGNNLYRVGDAAFAILIGSKNSVEDMQPKERWDHFKADREELRLLAEKKELIPVDEVRTTYANLAKDFVNSLAGMTDELERDIDLPKEYSEAIDLKLDYIRTVLAEKMTKEDDQRN